MKQAPIIVLIALLGLGLMAYPIISNYLYMVNSEKSAKEYNNSVSGLNAEELAQVHKEAVKYNENLAGEPVHDPFLESSGWALSDIYDSVLNVDNSGIMGYVAIPKIDIEIPIFHGTSEYVLQQGSGHMEGSSLPVGGPGSHCVLTGHTGLAKAKIFTDIRKLVEGDYFYLRVLNDTIAYKVDQINVVEPGDTSYLRREKGKDYCTLVTCTPYGINSHRLLVRGARTDYTPEMEKEVNKKKNMLKWFNEWNTMVGLIVGILAFVCILLPVVIVKRQKKKEDLCKLPPGWLKDQKKEKKRRKKEQKKEEKERKKKIVK